MREGDLVDQHHLKKRNQMPPLNLLSLAQKPAPVVLGWEHRRNATPRSTLGNMQKSIQPWTMQKIARPSMNYANQI